MSDVNFALRIAAILMSLTFGQLTEARTVRTKGYVRKNGTYVAPHYRTNPDHSKANNWSTRGNVNPYTGKKGTVDPNR
jgi:hypothetical protein